MDKKRIEILLVDDDESHLEMIARAFESSGKAMRLCMERTLCQARQKLAGTAPNLIIADLRLPDGDGTELIPQEKDEGPFPVIIMTGQGDQQAAVQAMKMGALDYIVKSPVAFNDLPHVAERVLAQWDVIIERNRARKQIAEEEKRFRSLLDSAPDAMVIVDTEGMIRLVNKQAESLFRYRRKEIIGQHVELLIPSRYRTKHPQHIRNYFSQPRARAMGRFGLKLIGIRSDRTEFPTEISLSPIDTPDGLLAVAAIRDITDRKQAEKELQIRDRAIASAMHGIVIVDTQQPHHPIIYCNPAFERLTGYSRDEVIGRNCRFLQNDDCAQAGSESLRQALRDGRECTTVLRNYKKDGTLFWNEVRISPVHVTAGRPPSHFIGFQNDITSRVKSQQKLRRSEERLRLAMTAAKLGVFDIDLITGEANWSASIGPIYGLPPATPMPNEAELLAMIHADDRAEEIRRFKHALKTADVYENDFRVFWPDGSMHWVAGLGRVFTDAAGKPNRMVGIRRDITSRKEVEQALRDSEARYRALFEQSSDGVIVVDPETGKILEFSDRAPLQLGYTREEFAKLSILDFETEESPKEFMQHVDHIAATGSDCFETKFQTNSGDIRDVEVRATHISIGGRAMLQASWADITERKCAERQLRASETRYRRLMEDANDAILIADAVSGLIVDANREAEQLLKYSREELLAMHQTELHLPAERERYHALFREQVQSGGGLHSNVLVVDREGRQISVEISASVIEVEGKRFIQGIFRDLTERKKTEETLRRAERLSSVGTLAAGIAHEINNPISAAWTSAETALLLKDEPTKADLFDDALQTVVGSIKRCDQIIQNVLRISRNEESPKALDDVNLAIKRAVDVSHFYAQEHGVQIELQLAPAIPNISMNQLEIQQVVLNLIYNAIEASQQHTRVTIRTTATSESVFFSIQDRGRGLSDSAKDKVFDPFFTDRISGDGVGLGMSIVHRIIEDHGGTIKIEGGQAGKGTIVSVELPIRPTFDKN